jgi:hypothetical protein
MIIIIVLDNRIIEGEKKAHLQYECHNEKVYCKCKIITFDWHE